MSQFEKRISSTTPPVYDVYSVEAVNEIDKAVEQGSLIVVLGAEISIAALKCSTARSKTEPEKTAKAESLKWKSLILGGLDYLEAQADFTFNNSECRELKFYRDCLLFGNVNVSTLLRAAGFLKSELDKVDRLNEWLDLIFKNLYDDFIGEGPNEVLDSIRKLYDSSKRIKIITTNYDDLVTRHCKAYPIVPNEEHELRDFFSNQASDQRILHLQGIWSEGRSVVLGGSDYLNITAHSYFQHALKSCLSGPETLLFVGTCQGLEDLNYASLLKWAGQELRGPHKKQYVLVADADGEKLEMRPGQDLKPIKYGRYSQLPSWLRERVQKIGKNKSPLQSRINPGDLPVSGLFIDKPSGEESKNLIINDETQYRDYYLRKNLGWKISNERQSFPISCRSEEAIAFEKTLSKLKKDLSDQKIRWTSVDCIGRSDYGTADPIKSTILITVPPGHSPKYKPNWECALDNKKINLNIEIINGGIEQECFGEADDKMDPLACGSSCGSLSHPRKSGTIGGFVTLTNEHGDQDDKSVYAMSCHHVFAPDQPRVKWNEKIRCLYKMIYEVDGRPHPGHEQQDITTLSSWAKVAFAFREGECQRIFEVLSETTADNLSEHCRVSFLAHFFLIRFCQSLRQLGSKYQLLFDASFLDSLESEICSFLSAFKIVQCGQINPSRHLLPIESRQSAAKLERMEEISGLLSKKSDTLLTDITLNPGRDSNLILRKLLNLFGLDTASSLEEDSRGMEGLEQFSKEPLAPWINTWIKKDSICKASSCFIDHPSSYDRKVKIRNLENRLAEYDKNWAAASSKSDSPNIPSTSADLETLVDFSRLTAKELKERRDIDKNPAMATIGAISVSSGIEAKHVPSNTDAEMEYEDWGLAKLLPSIDCQNFHAQNILAPSSLQKKGQEVRGVRPWKNREQCDRLKVFKRGRTTDYTVGTIHGLRRHFEHPTSVQEMATHIIVSEDPARPFSKRGDSGSWVIDSQGLLVGMIWGRSDGDDTTLFTPAEYIFSYISERITEDGGPRARVCKIFQKGA